jgi:biotin carboxyl carrier protein
MPTRYRATLEGIEHELEIAQLGAWSYRVKLGSAEYQLDVHRIGQTSFSILIGDRSFDLEVACDSGELLVASRQGITRVILEDAARYAHRSRGGARAETAGPVEVKAMMPGRIVNVLVRPGDEVARNQGLVVVEAMKMENELKSPKAGRVIMIKVSPGQTVEKGDLLLIIE